MANKLTLDNVKLVDNGDGTFSVAVSITEGVTVESVTVEGPLAVTDNDTTLSIDDGNGTITVDGTVTANLSATDNTVLDNIDTDTSAIQTAAEAIQTAVEGTLDVNIVSGATSGVQYTEGDSDATGTGTLAMGVDGDTMRAIVVAADGAIHVDDGGNTLTVDGTVTANLSATDNTVLDDILAAVDGTEALLTTIDADTSTLSTTGGGVEAGALRVTIASDSTGVVSIDDNGTTISVDDGAGTLTVDGNVGGKTARISGSVTRPTNTTQYAIGEVINATSPTVITFANAALTTNGSGLIVGCNITTTNGAATKPQLRLWLFNAGPTPDSDNAAITLTASELNTSFGVIDLTAETWYEGTASTNALIQKFGIMMPFVCSGGVSSIYGVLEVRNAYTPASGEVFTCVLTISQD